MGVLVPFAAAVGAGATGTGIAAASFVGPLTMAQTAGVAIGSSVGMIGTAFSALGALSQAGAQSAAAKRNAQAEMYNRQVAEVNAKQARNSAEMAAGEEAKLGRRRVAAIRSGFSKGGVVTTAGSPLLAALEQAEESGIEQSKIRYQGEVQHNKFMADASIATMKARAFKQEAKSARTAGFINTGKAILTGTSLL